MSISSLPDKQRVIDYVLSLPVLPEGQRHKLGILPCMIQLASNGIGLEESIDVVSRLYPIGSGKRKVTRQELADAWTGAKDKNYAPWIETFAGSLKYARPARAGQQQQDAAPKIKSFTPTGRSEAFTGIDVTPSEFINRLFGKDDWVCLGKKDDSGQLSNKRERFMSPDAVESFSPKTWKSDQGVYFISNPLKDWESRKDDNVSDYRRLLVELEVPKDKREGMTEADIQAANEVFFAAIKDSGLPCEAVYTSGGPSVHAQIRINAKSYDEFKEWQAFVYEYCKDMPGFDGQNGNPARYSRLPGAYHGDRLQQLICWQIGAESIQKWKDELPIDDGLPDIESYDALEADETLVEPPELVKGVLHKASKMVLGSNSKGRKTMLLIDCGLSIASGADWLDFQTTQGRVLYVNMELQKFFFRKRIKLISEAKGLKPERFSKNFDSITLRGHAGEASKLIPAFIRKIGKKQYDAIIIDPTYKLLGKDGKENETNHIANMLNEFERLAVQNGAAVICASHFSKGNQAGKESMDRIGGSGVWARDPDSLMTLTKHEEDDAMVVEFTLRNHPPIEAFTVRWRDWLFERCDLDPSKLKKPGFTAKYSIEQILGVLDDKSLSGAEFKEACQDVHGMSESTFDRLKKEAARAGKIYQSPLDLKWSKSARELEKS